MATNVPQPTTISPKPSGKLELDVSVASSAKVFYQGSARSVSSKNSVGPFDILPRHENFISLVKEKITIFDLAGKKFEFPIENGLLEVSEDIVRVFVGV
ncbi:MAG TPA: hypothetical protein VLE91_02845, partial [Candidatus Saccharimonadales bacterium]|nr:hypothetical protein [Candidatus Saccharimonadales bacterium]